MTSPDVEVQLALELATVALQREARRFATVVDAVAAGECSQELLRARVHALEAAAREYAAAHGGQAPGAARDG